MIKLLIKLTEIGSRCISYKLNDSQIVRCRFLIDNVVRIQFRIWHLNWANFFFFSFNVEALFQMISIWLIWFLFNLRLNEIFVPQNILQTRAFSFETLIRWLKLSLFWIKTSISIWTDLTLLHTIYRNLWFLVVIWKQKHSIFYFSLPFLDLDVFFHGHNALKFKW